MPKRNFEQALSELLNLGWLEPMGETNVCRNYVLSTPARADARFLDLVETARGPNGE